MKNTIPAILALALVTGCSGFDFFGFEEDTGIYVISRPEKYDNASFGIKMATTSTTEVDLLAASSGQGNPAVFFQLSGEGKLVEMGDVWKTYPPDDETAEAAKYASGASLAGLPTWGADGKGCVAVGEPKVRRVAIACEPSELVEKHIKETAGQEFSADFGHKLAAIRPEPSEPWLLAVAAKDEFAVFSGYDSTKDRTDFIIPRQAGGGRESEIVDIAAGRVLVDGASGPDSLAFVVVSALQKNTDSSRVYLFVQTAPYAKSFKQKACIERENEVGFGAVLVTGDLNQDGSDELVISAAEVGERVEAVYVYDIPELLPLDPLDVNAIYCGRDVHEPLATVKPTEGNLNVTCEKGCNFGTAIAIGDIATDDKGQELIIGAPGAKVNSVKEAGVVNIYRGADIYGGNVTLAGQVADSSPQKGHWFGGQLVVAPMAGRNELIVATTGKGNIFVVFCTGVGENVEQGGDVTTNLNGSVISTRCRP